MAEKEIKLSIELIREKIYIIRGQKVMLDRDLAELYGVPAKRLNEQVKRNIKRFPEDFMFRLTSDEVSSLRSQFATLKRGQHSKYLPLVFTEHGVTMLASVLNSEKAVEISIQVVRAFIKIRELMSIHKDIYQRMNKLEIKQLKQDKSIDTINHVIEEMMNLPVTLKRKTKKTGFKK